MKHVVERTCGREGGSDWFVGMQHIFGRISWLPHERVKRPHNDEVERPFDIKRTRLNRGVPAGNVTTIAILKWMVLGCLGVRG